MIIFPTHTALQSIPDACVTVMKFKFNEYQLTSSMQYKYISKYTLVKDNVVNICAVTMDTTKSVIVFNDAYINGSVHHNLFDINTNIYQHKTFTHLCFILPFYFISILSLYLCFIFIF